MPPTPDLVGQRFGRLLVLKRAENNRHGQAMWHCRCDCGKSAITNTGKMRQGQTSSCGCLRLEVHTSHGLSHHPLFDTWKQMMARCYNPDHESYHRYGAVGISVCGRWHDLASFISDMGERPEGMTLDRIDNNKGYELGNCRWATKLAQTLNRGITRNITYQGRTQCIAHWAREFGLPQPTLDRRLAAGWPIERALTQPLRRWPGDLRKMAAKSKASV